MPESELVPVDVASPVRFLPSRDEAGRIMQLAEKIATTDFVPRGLRGNPPAILAAMLTGREIGIGAMHSLRAIDVIDGRPSLSPELMASLVLRHPAGHELYPEEATRERCVMVGRRGDWPADRPPVRVEWTLDDARLAGLVDPLCEPAEGQHAKHDVRRKRRGEWVTEQGCDCRQGWQTYPRAMLRARATAELCRAIFPDVVERIGYTVEELGGEPAPHAVAMDVVRDVSPETAVTVDATYDDDDAVDPESGVCPDCGDAVALDEPHSHDDEPDDAGDDGRAESPQEPPDPAPGPDTAAPPDNAADADDGEATDVVPWRDLAKAAGITPTSVLIEVRKRWPHNDQYRQPNRLGDVDELVDQDEGAARLVADVIEELAKDRSKQ